MSFKQRPHTSFLLFTLQQAAKTSSTKPFEELFKIHNPLSDDTYRIKSRTGFGSKVKEFKRTLYSDST
jgi:hypothetical protein